jgi:hypothetical protein
MKRNTTEKEMRRWNADGKSWAALADALGVHPQVVYAAASILGIAKNKKMPEVDLQAVTARLANGEQLTAIAKSLGVSRARLYQRLRAQCLPSTVLGAVIANRKT